ncbi:putative arylsulfatase domain protein [Rhodococcus sp. MTM3W5.2]|nr:putative arylsulfatase domain protein [Rhodococcus sp. MTM3W5.2]
MAAAWDEAAWANTVFPLLNGGALAVRRPAEQALSRPVRLLAGTPPLERYRSSKLIAFRDFEITAELGGSGFAPGDEGVLVAHGDPQGGYLLYIEDGHLVFGLNSYGRYASVDAGPVPVGARRIEVSATVTPRLRWDFTVRVDGAPAGNLLGQVQLVGMAPWTGISVGVDARGPVSWDLRERRGPFRYTGALRAVTYTPGPVQVPGGDIERIEREAEYAAD